MESFKYLGAIISNEGSKPEILSRIAQTTAAFSRLKIIWSDKNISLLRLSWCRHSSYLPSFMPVRAGPWQHKSREGSKPLRWNAIGDFWTFPTKTMWRTRRFATESGVQLECMMNSDGMATSQDPLAWRRQFCNGQWKEQEGEEDKKRWEDNIKEWMGIGFGDSLRAAEDREGWKGIVATSSVVPQQPPRLRDWDVFSQPINDKFPLLAH